MGARVKRAVMKSSKMQISRKEGLTMKLQKLGGYASIVLVCIYIVSAIIVIPVLQGITGLDIYDPVKMSDAYQASPMAFLIYYILGILIAILTLLVFLALEERMRTDAPHLMRLSVISASAYSALYITAMIGGFFRNVLVSATNDMSTFRTFLVFHEFLSTAAISVLGWGLLLIGWATIRTRILPLILGYIIFIFGIWAIILFAFVASQFTFGIYIYALLSLIVFTWLGVVLLRKSA
jgi:hypothetical protein